MRVTLHIERLVLDGLPVDGAGRAQLRAAVEAELVRRLQLVAPAAGRAVDAVRPRGIDVADQPGPGVLGTRIGAAVAEGIGP